MTPLERAREALKKLRVWDDKTQRFTRINISVDRLFQIVKHLEAKGSMYDLHNGKRRMPVASLNTIRKIRDAWKSGALNQVLAPAVEQILESELTVVDRDQIETAQERLNDHYEAAYGGKKWRWDVRHLEEIGLYPEQALGVLGSYDKNHEASRDAQVAGRKFRGLNLYLAVHYIAIFHLWFPRAPFHYINMAAHGHADILLESRARDVPRYTTSAMDMLRYEIWRGDKHRNAYYSALGRHHLNAKRIAQLKEGIDRIKVKDTLVIPTMDAGATDWEQAMTIMEEGDNGDS
jgi:hypothetical protein